MRAIPVGFSTVAHARRGDHLRAVVGGPLDSRAIETMIARSPRSVHFWPGSEPMSTDANVDFLADLPDLNELDFDWQVLPVIPDAVFGRLEALTATGRRAKVKIQTGSIARMRELEVFPRIVDGPLSLCGALEELTLRGWPTSGVQVVDGCHSLTNLKMSSRGGLAEFIWRSAPQRLSTIQLHGVRLESLAGIERIPTLEMLIVQMTRSCRPELDLAPLAECAELRVVILAGVSGVINREALQDLPHLLTTRIGPT